MLHTTIAYLAWIVVVLIQAIVHFWIFKSSKRKHDDGMVNPSLDKMDASIDSYQKAVTQRRHELVPTDDHVPPMVPHVQISEDEYDEDPDQESFDGDEPLIFFELLDKTGSEMIKSCCSLEKLVHEQLINVDAVDTALALSSQKIQLQADVFVS